MKNEAHNIDRSLTECVSLHDLEGYALGNLAGEELDRVMDHIAECDICSRRFEIVVEHFSGPADSYAARGLAYADEVPGRIEEIIRAGGRSPIKLFPRPSAPAPGQLWLIDYGEEETESYPLLAVLLPGAGERDGEYPAAVISWETAGAAGQDLIVEKDESPIGIGFIVEAWNRVSLPEGELDKCLGVLTPRQLKKLTRILKKSPGEKQAEGDIMIGSPITGLDDERIFFQSIERRRAEHSGRSISGKEVIGSRAYSLAGVSAMSLLSNLRACFQRTPEGEDSSNRSFFVGLKKFYQKYLIPAFPIAIGLAIPIVAHIFFKKLSKSLDRSKIPSSLKPESELIKGLSFCGLGRWQDALNIFSRVLASPLTLFGGLVFSAWILARMGKFKQASESIRKARELPRKEQTFQIDFARIERFIEEEREAEFKEWFDNSIGNYILKESARLISSL
ncbi:MAG: hypothetical protein U9N73_01470 [Candidatus Auribacterota bacterium]|nr:hypothetical protein [Candidatus Auribacterota bacterium]